MELNDILIIIGCVISIIIIGAVFKVSAFKILKLIFNSILGGILIFVINQIGANYGLHIGLNVVTSIFVGLFGIPGAIVLLLLKIF